MNHPSDRAFRVATCRPGEGAASCSYLIFGAAGFDCAKGSSFLTRGIEERRSHANMTAQGDNCSGPPAYRVKGNTP